MLKRRFRAIRRVLARQRRSRLVANSDDFWRYFRPSSKIKRLATGFRFTEGPIWVPAQHCLLFTDIPANKIYVYDAGRVSVFREPSHFANGLTLDQDGSLIICEHKTRRVARLNWQHQYEVLADSFKGTRLNSPNDVIVRSDGVIFFTDPPYGIKPSAQELAFQGVFCLDSAGVLALVTDQMNRPNGLAFSPDESVLYVDDSAEKSLVTFDYSANVNDRRPEPFFDLNRGRGNPDGMCVHDDGTIFCTGAEGVYVITPAGHLLGVIATAEKPSNCTWGEEQQTLFITAQTSLYCVELK